MGLRIKELILNGNLGFDYKESFKRNIGWVSEVEQERLRTVKVAIGGLGGVGGNHLLAMVRMGIQNFNIADLDEFDYSNFNRQDGANVETIGLSKVEVSRDNCMKINPNLKMNIFNEGVNESNIDQFLEGVDIYVDSLDIFAIEARKLVFRKCREKGIAAFTCAPLGMGLSFLAFTDKSMSFDDYFGFIDPKDEDIAKFKGDKKKEFQYRVTCFGDNICRFITGVGPKAYQRHYLVDPTKVDFFTKNLPSIKPGIDLAAGAMATNVLKHLLGRGKIIVAPRSIHFDAFLNSMATVWLPFGHKNPRQWVMRRIVANKIDFDYKLKKVEEKISELDLEVLANLKSDKDLYGLISNLE